MKYTNLYNLPEEIVSAIINDDYDHPTDKNTIPVHTLISPVKLAILEQRHQHEAIEDCSDSIWRLFGQSIHYILDKQIVDNSVSEKRLYAKFKEKVISGRLDRFHANTGELKDFKVTSVWKVVYGKNEGVREWEEQLNMYAWLRRMNGDIVNKLTIVAILRDWQASEASRGGDYPLVAIQSINIPLWSKEIQEEFIDKKLCELAKAESLPDDLIKECSPEDRWASPDKYAIMKEGRKSAVRVFDTKEECAEYMVQEKVGEGCDIVKRDGENKRCLKYCSFNRWCNFYNKEVVSG